MRLYIMHTIFKEKLIKLSSATGLVLGMLFSVSAYTQTSATLQSQYQADLQYCDSAAVIDKQACKNEAAAALSEAKKGNLTGAASDARSNRCQYLSGDKKTDCEMLMQNSAANVQGSVQSGGIIRSMEYEYTPAVKNSDNSSKTDDSVTETYKID